MLIVGVGNSRPYLVKEDGRTLMPHWKGGVEVVLANRRPVEDQQ